MKAIIKIAAAMKLSERKNARVPYVQRSMQLLYFSLQKPIDVTSTVRPPSTSAAV